MVELVWIVIFLLCFYAACCAIYLMHDWLNARMSGQRSYPLELPKEESDEDTR